MARASSDDILSADLDAITRAAAGSRAPEPPQPNVTGGTFYGSWGNDVIHGGEFGDLIIGNASANPFIPDNDTLYGEEG